MVITDIVVSGVVPVVDTTVVVFGKTGIVVGLVVELICELIATLVVVLVVDTNTDVTTVFTVDVAVVFITAAIVAEVVTDVVVVVVVAAAMKPAMLKGHPGSDKKLPISKAKGNPFMLGTNLDAPAPHSAMQVPSSVRAANAAAPTQPLQFADSPILLNTYDDPLTEYPRSYKTVVGLPSQPMVLFTSLLDIVPREHRQPSGST